MLAARRRAMLTAVKLLRERAVPQGNGRELPARPPGTPSARPNPTTTMPGDPPCVPHFFFRLSRGALSARC